MKIELSHEAKRALQGLKTLPPRLALAIARALDRENELTVGYIQANKLSRRGPTTLGVRTGLLRRSVRPALSQIVGNRIVSSIGSNVIYAGVHEFGFDGEVSVKAFQRRNPQANRYQIGGVQISQHTALRLGLLHASQASRLARESGRFIFARRKAIQTSSGVSQVKAHQRHMRIKARAPIRTGIEERQQFYADALSRAVTGALNN